MDKKKKEQWPPHLWPPKYIEVHGKKVKVIMRQEGSRQGYVHGKVEFGEEDCCFVVLWDGEYGEKLYKFERRNGMVRAFERTVSVTTAVSSTLSATTRTTPRAVAPSSTQAHGEAPVSAHNGEGDEKEDAVIILSPFFCIFADMGRVRGSDGKFVAKFDYNSDEWYTAIKLLP